jgi:S1-C subfamily serine protease
MSKELAQALGLGDTKGAIIARVHPGSPAEAAGLAQNDVVTRFDGVSVEDYHHLQRLSSEAEVGKTVKLDYVRRGQRKTIDLKIAESPDSAGSTQPR